MRPLGPCAFTQAMRQSVLLRWAFSSLLMGMCLSAWAGVGTRPTRSETGAALYARNCSGCHGADGRGRGVIAPYLKATVRDLTLITARAGGTFPADAVFRIIDGQSSDAQVTERRHMPIWGYEFFGDDADDRVAHDRSVHQVKRLVQYLRSIQSTRDCSAAP